MELIRFKKAKFDRNSLIISDSITIDEWKQLGTALKQVEECIQFWIGDWARFGDKKGFTGKYTDPKVYDELEEITGLARGTIQNMKSVGDKIESSRRREDLSFEHHREVAKLPPEKQSEFLKKASDEKLSVRDLREQIRKVDIAENYPKIPTGKYRVIYADPPWEYSNSMPGYFIEQANHYQLMTVKEISELDIKNIAEDDAVLFLWVTSPILEESFEVIKAWGFKYKTSFVWDKIKHNMGHYNSVRHEFLLICTRGSCTPDIAKLFDSVQSIERAEHSAKPEFFREIIDTIYPDGKRIELFARKKTEGWEVFGNES